MSRKINLPFNGESITMKQLADRWGLSYNTIRSYAAYYPNKLPPMYRISGMNRSPVRFSLKEVEDFERIEKTHN